MIQYPKQVGHWIAGKERQSSNFFPKLNPATGKSLAEVSRGDKLEAEQAALVASQAFEGWASKSVAERAKVLADVVSLMEKRADELAEIVSLECGKSKRDSLSEIAVAVKCASFFAAIKKFAVENLKSNLPGRSLRLERQGAGVGLLITPFNNPAAGIAWKIFPALLCGNTAVLKSHEETPYVAIWFAKVMQEVGLPDGVFNVVQGYGPEAGGALVADPRIEFISFTGSAATGSAILKSSADRLAKVAIESGGKNPMVVCDDADLDRAVEASVSASFVDAGQRCAAAGRIIVFHKVYDKFREKFLNEVKALSVGVEDSDDFGAIISEKRLSNIIDLVDRAVKNGATLLTGGHRIEKSGYFMQPTVLENVPPTDEISNTEVFGPVPILYRVKDFEEAVSLANNSPYKLSSAIFTKSRERADEFIKQMRVGVVRVNGPTHGSEPHVPFGGLGLSGNGWREPGRQALDFYTELKQVSVDN